MNAIYEKPIRELLLEWVDTHVSADRAFTTGEAVAWFKANYPAVNPNSVRAHLTSLAVNCRSRLTCFNVKPGAGWDHLYQVDRGRFRRWRPDSDPQPIYAERVVAQEPTLAPHAHIAVGAVATCGSPPAVGTAEQVMSSTAIRENTRLPLEVHLHAILVQRLESIEPGLRLYRDQALGQSGIEFPAGRRYIDILALDRDDRFVVIELKRDKTNDAVIGQILYYMSWVRENLANGEPVRGIIIGAEINDSLVLAASHMDDVTLLRYEHELKIFPVGNTIDGTAAEDL